eukprot:scaffold26736_cov59-Cyclotella_meneghiniana.AAC.3
MVREPINWEIYNKILTHRNTDKFVDRQRAPSSKGRRMVYRRTDKGKTGVNAFFKTHKCTKICAPRYASICICL